MHELLWSMNPNLTPESIARLRLIRQDGRERCNYVIAKARNEMPPEQFAQYLIDILPILVMM